jgi:beta-N-acetylhexosaminidase
MLIVMPRPADLTPADTSAAEPVPLAAAIRRRHAATDELMVSPSPTPAEVSAVRAAATTASVVIVGTVSASLDPAQVALVEAVLGTGRPTITVAFRTPWDLAAYPAAGSHLCTYSLTQPSCEALAAACFGELSPVGRLPVAT